MKHTAIPSGGLPERDAAETSPDLVFRKWHGYDRFQPPFEKKDASRELLHAVRARVQAVGRNRYVAWHESFDAAARAVGAEMILKAPTAWRLLSGWATNPALESGIVLHPLLGFPCIPGSGVKGLVHSVAERELVEGESAVPSVPEVFPTAPPQNLEDALLLARRIRVVFGSVSSTRAAVEGHGEVDFGPEAAVDRLKAWREAVVTRWAEPDAVPSQWRVVAAGLATVLSEAGTGALVGWLDAVPDPRNFSAAAEPVLDVDVLTPHYPTYYEESAQWRRASAEGSGPLPADNEDPRPVNFLALRPGAALEFRVRIGGWPRGEPRDPEEEERAAALFGWTRRDVADAVTGWLRRGLALHGLGAKTTAGYGYFGRMPVVDECAEPAVTALAKLKPSARQGGEPAGTPDELWARDAVPEGLDRSALADVMDGLHRETPARQAAAAARIVELYPKVIEDWRSRQRPKIQNRIDWLDRALGGDS